MLAVPLVNLGGIINTESTTKLPGQPSWLNGVQSNREQKVNVVDTAAWVMPEKYTDELKHSISLSVCCIIRGQQLGVSL